MSRKKKILFNIFASGTYEIVAVVCSLILPWLFIGAYGSENNGLIHSIQQFLEYISILSIGIAGPTRVALYRTLNDNDIHGTSAILKAHRNTYIRISVYFILYTVILLLIFPHIVDSNMKWYEIVIMILLTATGMLFEYSFGTTYQTLLEADQCNYIFVILRSIGKILNTLIGAMLICNGYSIFVYAAENAFFIAIQPVLLKVIVSRKYKIEPDVEPDYTAIDQRKDAAACSIANVIHSRVDVALLTLFSSTTIVSVYSVYALVTTGVLSVVSIFLGSVEALFGSLIVRNDKECLKKYFSAFEQISFMMIAMVFSCMGSLLVPFISLYTKNISDANYVIPFYAFLLTLSTASYRIREPYLMIVQAAGRYKETKAGNYIEAGINIFLSLILVRKFNLIGVTIGTLAANIFRTVQYSMYASSEILDRPYVIVLKRIVWLIGSVCVVEAAFHLLPGLIRFDNWTEFVLSGAKCISVSSLVVVILTLLFYKSDLQSIVGYFVNKNKI